MSDEPMTRSSIRVPGMDCDAEASLVRAALQHVPGISRVALDLRTRSVLIDHVGPTGGLIAALSPLGYGAELTSTGPSPNPDAREPSTAQPVTAQPSSLRRALVIVLVINAAMFLVELVAGIAARSTGLLADSLDMLADASVYAIALAAAADPAAQRRAGRASGWLQLGLAIAVLVDVVRRALGGSEPVDAAMIGVGLLALAANTACLALLARHRAAGAHLRASWIFTTNDTLANLGVILAGVLVAVTGSAIPDLLIGTAIAVLVASGAWRILRPSRP